MRRHSIGIVARISLAAVVCILVLVPTVGILATEIAALQAARTMMDRVPAEQRALEHAGCRADPSHWSVQVEGRYQLFAYDGQSLRSANPDAPVLDPALVERLREGEDRPGELSFFDSEWGGQMLDRMDESGPCAVILLRWRAQSRPRSRIRLFAATVLFAGLSAGLTLVMLVAVRPILVRLRRLAKSARQVGAPEGYESAGEVEGDAIGEIGAVLDGAHERILNDRAALKEHLATIAHDLRTPLASLQLAVEEAATESDEPRVVAALDSALDDLVYLDGLTSNLHLASKLERELGPLDGGHRTDLGQMVDFVVARFRVLGRRKGIGVHGSRPDEPVLVRCDPSMAQQVLSNLVHNAVKYGDSGVDVAVVLERVGEGFELDVLDNGPGVDPDEISALSQRDFRTSNAIRRDAEGAGLGLAIVRRVCEMADFSLRIEANEPTGLRVRIEGRTD